MINIDERQIAHRASELLGKNFNELTDKQQDALVRNARRVIALTVATNEQLNLIPRQQ